MLPTVCRQLYNNCLTGGHVRALNVGCITLTTSVWHRQINAYDRGQWSAWSVWSVWSATDDDPHWGRVVLSEHFC